MYTSEINVYIICLFDFNNTNKSHIITFMIYFHEIFRAWKSIDDDRFSEKNNFYIVNEFFNKRFFEYIKNKNIK